MNGQRNRAEIYKNVYSQVSQKSADVYLAQKLIINGAKHDKTWQNKFVNKIPFFLI